jgi:post-segregation antitoxin (ccd killing protein)
LHKPDVHFVHMRLDEYLRRSGMTLEQFGRKVGVSHSTVQRWRVGKSTPRDRGVMQAVVRASGGAVRAEDFFPAPRSPTGGLAQTPAPLLEEARSLGLDPDAIAAKALSDAIRQEKERRWQEDNREAIESQNAWIEKHGLPLAKYRTF